jgi:hypothetical protein
MPSRKSSTTSTRRATKSSHDSRGHMTTDHDVIRKWTEDRNGQPARVKRTGRSSGDRSGGLLRIDFQDRKGSLEPISWEDFFETFDKNNLVFLYQDEIDGQPSRFFKFISRETADEQTDGDEEIHDERSPIKSGDEEGEVSKSEIAPDAVLVDEDKEDKEEAADELEIDDLDEDVDVDEEEEEK